MESMTGFAGSPLQQLMLPAGAGQLWDCLYHATSRITFSLVGSSLERLLINR
jgi:hypothetical protein